jgi:hypothetical protein
MTCATSPDNPQKPIPNSTKHQLIRPATLPTNYTCSPHAPSARSGLPDLTTSLADIQI